MGDHEKSKKRKETSQERYDREREELRAYQRRDEAEERIRRRMEEVRERVKAEDEKAEREEEARERARKELEEKWAQEQAAEAAKAAEAEARERGLPDWQKDTSVDTSEPFREDAMIPRLIQRNESALMEMVLREELHKGGQEGQRDLTQLDAARKKEIAERQEAFMAKEAKFWEKKEDLRTGEMKEEFKSRKAQQERNDDFLDVQSDYGRERDAISKRFEVEADRLMKDYSRLRITPAEMRQKQQDLKRREDAENLAVDNRAELFGVKRAVFTRRWSEGSRKERSAMFDEAVNTPD